MLFSSSFFSLLVLSLSLPSSALQTRDSPVVTVPLVKRLNLVGLQNLVQHDVARAKFLRERAQISRSVSLGLTSRQNVEIANAGVSYVANIGVGSPPTNWHEYIDTVTLGPKLTLNKQSIGVANNATGIETDGILGIGPQDLTLGTLRPSRDATIPTVVDTAFEEGLINANQIGVYFEPYTNSTQTGELSYGDLDTSRYTGDLTYAPITSTSPASNYWGIDQTIRLGDTTILSNTAGIVDTGTTLMLIATDAFEKYRDLTGAVLDKATTLLSITPAQFDKLPSLFFDIAGTTFELTRDAQLWPRVLNAQIGGTPDGLYLIVADSGSKSGSGLDFLNGYAFLERFYTVYDTANQRVGFATTAFTNAETN
ncbi:hypothetical protein DXG01_015564 [Tephrocybe rancida]|nr:hypothetical protein DXG01_015564 [Tephrocybe rancida]